MQHVLGGLGLPICFVDFEDLPLASIVAIIDRRSSLMALDLFRPAILRIDSTIHVKSKLSGLPKWHAHVNLLLQGQLPVVAPDGVQW